MKKTIIIRGRFDIGIIYRHALACLDQFSILYIHQRTTKANSQSDDNLKGTF